jgi:hypothetical protein
VAWACGQCRKRNQQQQQQVTEAQGLISILQRFFLPGFLIHAGDAHKGTCCSKNKQQHDAIKFLSACALL